MLIGKEVRVTTVNQRGVIRLAALNRAAKVIDQRFAHQVFRKIAPRLRSIVGTDSGQNAQPRFVARRLQIAEPAARMYRLCFDVNVAAIKLKAVLILQPAKRRDAVFNFQRRAKNGFIGHLSLLHRNLHLPVFYASRQRTGKMFRAGQQLPLFPGKIFPRCLKTRFFGGL